MSKYKILIVDDHPITRRGLQAVLELEKEFEIVGEAGNGQEAIKKAVELSPNIILMDLRMPEMDGITACRQIKGIAPEIDILILTAHSDEEDIFEAIEVGAAGCLLKDVEPDELVRAIRLVCQGRSFLHSSVAGNVLRRFSLLSKCEKQHKAFCGLTSREREVLGLMAKGSKNQEIASKLWVSEGTIKSHVSSILHKLKQTDRAQAVIAAFHLGIVDFDKSKEIEKKFPD